MKTKLRTILYSLIAIFIVGCKTPDQTRVLTRVAVQNSAYISLLEWPEARPFVAQAAVVICAAANTNASPAALSEWLDALKPKPAAGVLLVNSALSLVQVWQPDSPHGQAALLGACEGFNLALSGTFAATPTRLHYIHRR